MGFVSGFTGGVTLTLSLAYLSVVAQQRRREGQSRMLRAQALALEGILSPTPLSLPPSRAELAAAQRAASTELAKDRWNETVEDAVRWMQQTDWAAVREGLEARFAAVWGAAAAASEPAGDGRLADASPLRRARAAAEATGSGVSAAARDALDRARDAGAHVASTVEDKALEARLAGRRAVAEAQAEAGSKAAEAQGALAAALDRGVEKAQAVMDRVRSAVGLVEGEAAAAAAGGEALSPVEKALRQRFEAADAMGRGVEEVLRERYVPMDQRDNTILRGL